MRMLRALLRRERPSPTEFAHIPANGIGLLTPGENASITYLIDPYLASKGETGFHIRSDLAPPDESTVMSCCRTIVIVRYLPKRWLGWLSAFRAKGGRVVYFMDDDLMDPAATAGLPTAYAKKIHNAATRQRAELERLCDEFWVASGYLAEKYHSWSPVLLVPRPALAHVRPRFTTTICYHGTASHQAELEWLVPLIRSVQHAPHATSFEVFGDHAVNRMFRDISGVSILHPMNWPNYLSFASGVERDIALAPLLPLPFNAARGPTKFFDFVRMGAVGIYSNVSPYKGFIRDGVDGLLLPNNHDLWFEAILSLAADAPRRCRMAEAARTRALSMTWDGNTVPQYP